MEKHVQNDAASCDAEDIIDEHSVPGIIAALGEMKPGTIVTEEGLAQCFKRHVVSAMRHHRLNGVSIAPLPKRKRNI